MRRLGYGFLLLACLWGAAGAARAQTPARQDDGAEIYRHICQACHMKGGTGAIGAGKVPALAHDARLAVAAYPATIVAQGHGGMPWFSDILSPAQIASVVNYVRTHFGNQYQDALDAQTVESMLGPKKVDDH